MRALLVGALLLAACGGSAGPRETEIAVAGVDGGAVAVASGDPCGCGTDDAGAPLCQVVASCGAVTSKAGEIACQGRLGCAVQAIPGGPADACNILIAVGSGGETMANGCRTVEPGTGCGEGGSYDTVDEIDNRLTGTGACCCY